jgi:Putative Flp pilus-assembly TadE/G-like
MLSATIVDSSFQRGQVLPLMAVFLLVCTACFYFAIESGQMVAEKIRLTDAADAAAYSAATVEARALNYTAYANRAIIANQVAIAQALSLASWMDYFADVWQRLPQAEVAHLQLIPPDDLKRWLILQAVFAGQALATIEAKVNPRVLARAANIAAGAMITTSDLASRGLALSETLVRESLRAPELPRSPARQLWMAKEVVTAMDPAIGVQILPTSNFDSFLRRYSGAQRLRLSDVVMRSRDAFTREREWTLRNRLPLFGQKRFERTGGTALQGFERWVAQDDLTFVHRRFSLFGGGRKREVIATGWASVGPGGTSRGSLGSFPLPGFYSGIPTVYDLNLSRGREPRTTTLTVRTFKDRGATLTAGGVATARPSGRLALFDGGAANGELAALSRAEVFFDRSEPRHDGAEEFGSLYSPYWRVRLAPVTFGDKLIAATQQAGVMLP